MHRIDSPGAVEVLPSTSESGQLSGFFSGGNPATGQMATIVSNDWLNSVQEELVHIVNSGNIKLDKKDNTQLLQALTFIFGQSKNPTLFIGSLHFLNVSAPPEEMVQADGGLLQNVSTIFPEVPAWAENEANAEYFITEEAWQEQHASWNNMGGCTKFVYNKAADTLRVPDWRGMYQEAAGFDGLAVHGVHGDMIRNITGKFGGLPSIETPLFEITNTVNIAHQIAQGVIMCDYIFDTSKVVPTGNANKPRAGGLLACVYLGKEL